MAKNSKKGSFFESPIMRSCIKSSEVTLVPEAGLGYFIGPLLALISNGIINVWLVQYWDKVLGMGEWAPLFETLLPIISAVLIVIGNLFVGRLLEKKPTLAGKARPLILIGMPVILISFLFLFLVPSIAGVNAEGAMEINWATSVLVAVGYNLYYALAWPLYYTSHSALVNLSTRDGGKRGLLSTCIMAAQLAAAGVSGMFGGILVDALKLLPVYTYSESYKASAGLTTNFTNDYLEVKSLVEGTDYTTTVSRADANEKWFVLMIVMIVTLIIGCILEYYFTRERITEEQVKIEAEAKENKQIKKVSMGEQAKVCLHDKYWWIIIVFFFLYQFGGMMKNNGMSFYSQAMTGGNTLSSMINTIGAVPTALGMAIVWPIAAKIGKSKTIAYGGFLALAGAAIAFVGLVPSLANGTPLFTFMDAPLNVSGILAVVSFIIKALGTAPAMYIAIAVMGLVLDHQEAVHGIRTDGFTMAVYGSIMVAMSGLCNGIIVGINSLCTDIETKRIVHTILSYGVEGLCYLVMSIMFFFMNVEKFTKIDNAAITADQKAAVEAEGGTYVESEERIKIKQEQEAKEAKMSPEALAKFKEEEAKALEEFNEMRKFNGKAPISL